MITNSYDVVLIGTGHGNLVCGALLTKRGFRVLMIGHDTPEADYTIGGHTLPRSPFSDITPHSPVARRIYAELGLSPILRRRSHRVDPTMQVAIPGHRFEIPHQNEALLQREIEREFPSIRRPIEEFLHLADQSQSAIDALLETDVDWPPHSFLERRRFRHAARNLPPPLQARPHTGPLDQIPAHHPYRLTIAAPLRFSADLDSPTMAPLVVTRLYDRWRRGPHWLNGGYGWLRNALLEKIQSSTGDVRQHQRVESISTRRSQSGPATVKIAGSGEEIGCDFIIAGIDLASLLPLLPSRDPFLELFERIGEPQPRFFRYTLNLVLRTEGLPENLSRNVFFVRDTKRPLADANLLRLEVHPGSDDGTTLLCVQALLSTRRPDQDSANRGSTRERVLSSLREFMPFIDEHLVLVDSPHDGLPAEEVQSGRQFEPKEPWSRGPNTMEVVYGYPVLGPLGLSALPIRSPVRRLLMCGTQNLPALGREGQLLAAWSAARVITRSDRRKEWMRKSLWTKVEI